MKRTKVVDNMVMLYLMSIAKLLLPLLTLPYLTRVLSEESYGLVTYVKSCMSYMLLIIDFGFLLSSVKDIVNADGDQERINAIAGNTFGAKMILAALAGIILVIMFLTIPLLRINPLFVVLSFIGVAITVFLADFVFRGIEKMQYITIIYVVSKTISTALTFVMVKEDGDLIWIPVLDIIANVVSVVLSMVVLKRLNIQPHITSLRDCCCMLKESFVYFLSGAATTAFSALNTLIIGIYLTDLKQIAYWGLCLNIITTIQQLYTPICNSIYPHMIKEKSLRFIHKIMAIFMPIVIAGCILSFAIAKEVMFILGGEKYIPATSLFRWMIPVLFFSFPAQIYGWPTLGAMGKEKQTTLSTIIASVSQIAGIVILILCQQFTVINLAILRGVTECLLMVARMLFVYRSKADLQAI